MRHRSPSFEWLLAAVVSGLIASGAYAATKPTVAIVEASVRFPGEARTAAVVYARNLDTGAVMATRIEAGQPTATVKLPPGRYWLFAEPDDPGAPDLLGAYTEWSRCRILPQGDQPVLCQSHALAELVVGRTKIEGLAIDDWYLPADIVRQLDTALNRSSERPEDLELGAPRFSEYPVRVPMPESPFRFDRSSHPEASQWEGSARAAAVHGVNFAGHWLIAAVGCGEGCTSYALVEWSTGRLFAPDALRALTSRLPCEHIQPVQHRADSRLLTVTQPDERNIATRYYLWDEAQGSLTEIASYRSSAQRYCGRD